MGDATIAPMTPRLRKQSASLKARLVSIQSSHKKDNPHILALLAPTTYVGQAVDWHTWTSVLITYL